MIVNEELDGIDIDDIGNLEDLLRIVFLHDECGGPKVFVDHGELTRNINTDRCPLCDKWFRTNYFFNTNVEYCESGR